MIGSQSWNTGRKTVAKIRRLHRVQGKSIKAIYPEFGISRKVVRKVLRCEEAKFRCSRARQPQPKLGPWQAELERLLEVNEARPRRERLTLVRVDEALRKRDCRKFRVWRGIVEVKETSYGPTERAADPGCDPGPVAGG
jgi:transposase